MHPSRLLSLYRYFVIGMGIIVMAPRAGFTQPAKPPLPSVNKPESDQSLQQKSPSAAHSSSDELLSPPSTQTSAEFVPAVAQQAAAEGNTAFTSRNFKQALLAYQEVLQLAPNNLVGLVNLGVIQYRLGDFTSAEKNLKQAISLRLETGVAWLTLGSLYMDRNRLDEAFAALAQARLYDSQNPRIHNYLGVVMNRMGWSDAAESELRTAVELDNAYSDAHYNLAVIYMDRNPPAVELAKRHYYFAMKYGALRDANMEKSFKNAAPPLPEFSHSSK